MLWPVALRDQEYQNVIVKLINAFANSQVKDRDEAPMAYYEQQGTVDIYTESILFTLYYDYIMGQKWMKRRLMKVSQEIVLLKCTMY